MRDVVYAVEERGWLPKVVREGDQLQLIMGIDVNRGYDIREFQFPITEQHLDVLRASLARHLILWCVLAPLAEKAGSGDRHGTPDPEVAATAIDMVLFGSEQQVEAYVAESVRPYELQSLIAHGGDPALIGEGRLFRALQGRVRVGADWKRVREHRADEARAAQGVHLGPLDQALLRYDSGPTTPSNGRGVCERGNYVRELPGWSIRLIDPDTHTVITTTPTGHHYLSNPPEPP